MENLVVIRKPHELENLRLALEGAEFVAFDTETTGIDTAALVIGFSVARDNETGYYVVLRYWDAEKKELIATPLADEAQSFFSVLTTYKLVMHNAVFDCGVVRRNYGVDLMPSVHTDTMLLGHILDENRSNGLKDLAISIFGESSGTEQAEMKASVLKNGGKLTKAEYELYKADSELIAKYGAKDTILTMKLFYHFVPELYEQGLDKFFYEEETMPLLKGPTYELNTTGLKVDQTKLLALKVAVEGDILVQGTQIRKEIAPHIADKYPGTTKAKTFNLGSSKQLAWLLFEKLGEEFLTLTDEGRVVCTFLGLKLPYTFAARRDFIENCRLRKDEVYVPEATSTKTGKKSRAKKITDFWFYTGCGKETIDKYSAKYKWCEILAAYNKNIKLLNTYIRGIMSRIQYGIIRPSFLQHGTTSGRYASRNPNFQNLPRDDKRIKDCIVARPGCVFVAADYSQLEPRVFASVSGDERLLACFETGEDFYSVIGAEVFGKTDCSLKKDDEDSFAKLYPDLRQISKTIALSATYGTTANQLAPKMGVDRDRAQEIIYDYFEHFPKVKQFMLNSHELAKAQGFVTSLFGRPRRMPEAKEIVKIYGNAQHSDLPYAARNTLNLSVNHQVQSTAASIMNRAAIAFHEAKATIADCRLVLQVHDELIVECLEEDAEKVAAILKVCMEETVQLPGVSLVAEPKIGKSLAEAK